MATATAEPRGWFAVPAPIRELFKLFPLRVYAQEPLPARVRTRAIASSGRRPALYVFADDEDALQGRPSYNPSCLKWQTCLKIAGVDFELVPSNNHASPSGALPFLLVPPTSQNLEVPLTGEKIGRYARDHASHDIQVSIPRLEAYQALLAQNVRPAWLYALYLHPSNDVLLTRLYLPSSFLLRQALRHTLHTAATAEILKTTRRAIINPQQLYADADTALSALSTLLASDEWFFGTSSPSVFDAEVFAYTHLLLDETLGWQDDTLGRHIDSYRNLVEHRARLFEQCWGRS